MNYHMAVGPSTFVKTRQRIIIQPPTMTTGMFYSFTDGAFCELERLIKAIETISFRNEGDVLIEGQRLPTGLHTIIYNGTSWQSADGSSLPHVPVYDPAWLAEYEVALSAAQAAA